MNVWTENAIMARLTAIMNGSRIVSITAVEKFMKYCRQLNRNERPIIRSAPDGGIDAVWTDFSCRFFRDGTTAGYHH